MILNQKQSLVQKMVMNQKMINAVSLLNLSQEELEEEIKKEVRKNPALIFKNSTKTGASSAKASDNFQSFLENIEDESSETLQAKLLEQANENIRDEYILNTAQIIIQNLDNNGFNYVPIEELFSDQLSDNKITLAEIKKALHLVRRFDPIGCACSGFKQSLIVQAGIMCESPKTGKILDIYKDSYELVIKIIQKHYDVLTSIHDVKDFIKKLARKNIQISPSQAEDVIELFKSLTPYPARGYLPSNIFEEKSFITPVAEVIREGNEFKIVLTDNLMATIEIAPDYLNIKKQAISSDEKKQNKDFLQKANMIIDVLEYRSKTIMQILNEIVSIQHDFFIGRMDDTIENGKIKQGFLKPLTQKDLAYITGLSPSTISRTSNQKYIRCEWGIFEIKDFFSPEVCNGLSKDYIISQIEKIISGKNTLNKKLSDKQISKILKTQGISLSTRTVNKYRNELGIDSSYNR